ncbi:uncharacterized protein P174DRAFT_460578 [Aspergillus novofumigatus IBT 16806]|uniref:Protein PNS1 n=1 Tax=Aspergillus novofumigatus (strain IBT 16806) TaxID=1392255 RepID=A0A2I1CA53_ASPN1|nr:uncharacterized protein P174DRAFT_460578 [Aspergillus novofumigatus IBT 16806]PKX94509.1 hypothetical protein P174DRAFT_460578 [Aspergillus novofumigatus IBT 16806]
MTLDPYHQATSQVSNLPFGSRNAAQPAPLFFSATDDFRDEDDEAEREREIADFYALQRSRRHFGSSQLKDSSEIGGDGDSSISLEQQPLQDDKYSVDRESGRAFESIAMTADDHGGPDEVRQSRSLRGNLVDIRLEDTLRSDENVDKAGSLEGLDDSPPSVQLFREQRSSEPRILGIETFLGPSELFLISLGCLLATSFLIYLHTSAPSGDKSRWGDTIYLTVHGSFYLLGIYTVVSIFISLLWLASLRYYVRPLVYAMIFAVPVILYSFSLYPFISSFKGIWHGTSIQDKAMRVVSLVPFIISSFWIYNVVRSRHAIGKAIDILEFACRILAANLELLLLGLGILICIVSWTWVWMLMFARVFLGGHMSESHAFALNISSWWLGTYFFFVYIWSLGVIAGIQRSVTAATVSQWYFHRLATPKPTSRQIVQAAVVHSVTTLFGTVCFSKLIALSTRLPLLLLPTRLSRLLNLFVYSLVPSPLAALTDPLALTYAAIHSQPLILSARGLLEMPSVSLATAVLSFHPRSTSWSHAGSAPLLSYRLSKLFLHAARFMMSLALGFGGWVSAARNLEVPGPGNGVHGSMYAYVVGLIAGIIGWSILGAAEGVIADIVDASFICWSSEVGTRGGEARYCREAGWLFGEHLANDIRHASHAHHQAEP